MGLKNMPGAANWSITATERIGQDVLETYTQQGTSTSGASGA